MTRPLSKYVCLRCGSPVIGWLDGWKHANNGHSETRACGKPPRIISREQYEQQNDELVASVLTMLRETSDQQKETE